MEFMNAVLQLQPADETDNVISFDPARRSRLCAVGEDRAARQRPVRARSLVIVLAARLRCLFGRTDGREDNANG
jgi:hypothetical protein